MIELKSSREASQSCLLILWRALHSIAYPLGGLDSRGTWTLEHSLFLPLMKCATMSILGHEKLLIQL